MPIIYTLYHHAQKRNIPDLPRPARGDDHKGARQTHRLLHVLHPPPGCQRTLLPIRCHPMSFSGGSMPHLCTVMRIVTPSTTLSSISTAILAPPVSMAISSSPASISSVKSGGCASRRSFPSIPSPISHSPIPLSMLQIVSPSMLPMTFPASPLKQESRALPPSAAFPPPFRALPFRAASVKLITPPPLIMKRSFLIL